MVKHPLSLRTVIPSQWRLDVFLYLPGQCGKDSESSMMNDIIFSIFRIRKLPSI